MSYTTETRIAMQRMKCNEAVPKEPNGKKWTKADNIAILSLLSYAASNEKDKHISFFGLIDKYLHNGIPDEAKYPDIDPSKLIDEIKRTINIFL